MSNTAERPTALPVIPENIPAEVRARPQWVCWKWELRKGKWTKPPYQTDGQRKARSNDPATWTTFEAALAAYQAGRFDGIGYVLTEDDPFTIIDLDNSRAETGEVMEWATALLADWPGYAEYSPSTHGLRAIGRGQKPGDQCGPKKYGTGKVEVYDYRTAKYLTFTGHRLPDSPAVIADAQPDVTRIYTTVFPPKEDKASLPKPSTNGKHPSPPAGDELTDDELLGLARKAKNADKFISLYDRGSLSYHDGDPSRADAALCAMLAFWTRRDAEQIDRLFRASKMFRTKWDEKHRADGATYGQMTIEGAIANCKEVFKSRKRRKKGWKQRAEGTTTPPPDGNYSPDDDGRNDVPDWPPPAVIVLRQWLRDKFQPTFRRGKALYSAALGRDISVSEVSGCPTSEVLALLAVQPDAPTVRGGRNTDQSQLPYHYRTWLPVAWGDIAATLPEESESAEIVEPAREEFVRGLTAALVTMVPLSYRHTKDGEDIEEVQRRPVIEWSRKFAKGPKWESVRGYRIWARKDGDQLRVAIRAELLGQVHARALDGLGQKRLSELCILYGIGTPCHVRGGQARATELTPDFLADLLAEPIDPVQTDPDRQTDEGKTHAPTCEAAS